MNKVILRVILLIVTSCFTQAWGSESTQLTLAKALPAVVSWDDIVASVKIDAQKCYEENSRPAKVSQFFAALKGHEEDFVVLLNEKGPKQNILTAAIMNGQSALVKAFLDKGIDLNDNDLNIPYVCVAVSAGHPEVLKLLLDREANPGAFSVGTQNHTPLHIAAYMNDSRAVALLLEHGAQVEAESNSGRTPLMDLFVNDKLFQSTWINVRPGAGNRTPVARLLVETGHASVQRRSRAGKTVLHYYASNILAGKRDSGVFEFLIAQGALLDAQDNEGLTPLHDAAKNNNLFVAMQLIQQGASLNMRDNTGLTPLDYALNRISSKMVANLVRSGAQSSVPTNNAFLIATMADEPLCIDVLKAAASNRELLNNELNAALSYAASLGHPKCLIALLKHGASTEHVQPGRPWRALHCAVLSKRPTCVELLCKAGANKEFRQHGVSLPLHIAVGTGYGSDLAKILLDHGANIEGKDMMDGNVHLTPLHRAVKAENGDAARLLVSRGANVNARTSAQVTPLIYVVDKFRDATINELNMVEIMKLLLVHGASIDAVDGEGDSPLTMTLGPNFPPTVRKELIRNCFYGYMPTKAELLASSRRIFEVIKRFSGRGVFKTARVDKRIELIFILPPYVIAEILLSLPETRNDVIRMFLHQLRKGKLPQELLGDSAHMNLLQILFSSIRFKHGNATYVTEYIQGKLLPHVNTVRGNMDAENEDDKKKIEQLDALTQDLEADINDAINARYTELQEGAQKTLADLVPAPVLTPVPSPSEEPVAKRQRVEEPVPEEAEQNSALDVANPGHG